MFREDGFWLGGERRLVDRCQRKFGVLPVVFVYHLAEKR